MGHEWVKDDETPWCAAFAGSYLEKGSLTNNRALNARSYLKWGVKISHLLLVVLLFLNVANHHDNGVSLFIWGRVEPSLKYWAGTKAIVLKLAVIRNLIYWATVYRKPNLTAKLILPHWMVLVVWLLLNLTVKGGDIADQVGGIFNSIT